MGVLGQSKDQGAGAVVPNAMGPVDHTGFFQNIGAGFRQAVAGPHSTRVGDAIYQKRYYDEIIKALAAEGQQGEDHLSIIQGNPAVPRPYRNPFVSGPWENLTNPAHNPIADLYTGGDQAEIQQIWQGIARVRQTKPDFLKQFPNPGAIVALATQERQKQIAQANDVTSRANTAGSVGGFVGGMAGSVTSMDPENVVGGGFGTAAGKTVSRTIIRRAVEGAGANAAAATIGIPGQAADAERLGQDLTPGDMAHQVLESAAIGGVFGGAHAGAPHVAGAVSSTAGRVADLAAEHAPAPVRDALAAASIRAGTVKDRQLLTEYRRLHNPYAAVGDTSTPDERAAGHVMERDIENREVSPFTPEAVNPHEDRLQAIANDLGVDLSAKAVPSPAPIQTPTVRDQSAGTGPRRPASYEQALGQAEGTGKNPHSSAEGHFQFTEGTWLEYAPRVADTSGMSKAQILALRNDLPTASAAERLFRSDNARYLRDQGLEDSPGNLSLAHFLGKGDAAKVLKADPATPIERLVDPRSLAANRSVLAGKSASEVVAWANKRIGATVDGPVARPDAVGDEFDYADVPPYSTAILTPDEVRTDAPLMQYKSGGDENGVTNKLSDVTAWNPIRSSEILVWEPNDGGYIVVDGHQRTGLAKRLYPDDPSIRLHSIVLKEADGITAPQARVIGALRNIALGTGSLEDNARVLRDVPNAAELLKGAENKREIGGLANLNYEAFGAVLNNVIDPRIAAEIGIHAAHVPEAHMALVGLTKDLSRPSEAGAVVRQALADGFGAPQEHQLSLLGDQPQQALYVPIARILAASEKRLRDEKRTFKVLSEKAGAIEDAGNVLDRTANESKVIGNDEALAILDRTAHSSGPVRDALIAAARAELSGARRADAVNQFLDALAGIDLRSAARGAAEHGAAGERVGAEGSGSTPTTPDDELAGSNVPLIDRAIAARDKAEPFSDPVGEAAKQQTALIEHDLLMDAKASAGDTRGQGVFYHGARGEVPELTEGYYNENNIYGGSDTFYTTDARDIAGGYKRKRQNGRIYRVEERSPVNFFDMEERRPTSFWNDIFGLKDDDYGLEPMAIEEAGGGHDPNLREIMDEIRDFSREEGYSKHDVQEIFDTAIHNLKERSFGGMTHVGGLLTGREPHTVRIYFDAPNQLELHDITPPKERPNATEQTGESAGAQDHSEQPESPGTAATEGANGTGEPVREGSLDLGAQTDPAIAERQRQEMELRATSPKRPGDIDAEGTMGLALFDVADQPTFRISDEGDAKPIHEIMQEAESDELAADALRNCLQPPKVTP